MTRYLVTGGAGFIGHHLVRALLADAASEVLVLDKLTYAGNAEVLAQLAEGQPRLRFERADIADRARVCELLAAWRPDVVFHLAAESHVDRSIAAPAAFIDTNIVGTFALLQACAATLAASAFRFVHVSTDEVFGALGADGAFVETSPYAPRSPYAASKAASDHLVASYVHTYGFPAIITHCCNNYGPYQYPEKLIPRMIACALAGRRLPVYGTGANVRDWIHVDDHCAALRVIAARGEVGETYVIGARSERTNLAVVHAICDALDALVGGAHREGIELVTDRLGHDHRYAVDPGKLERALGWRAEIAFAEGLRDTVRWYVEHRAWLEAKGGASCAW